MIFTKDSMKQYKKAKKRMIRTKASSSYCTNKSKEKEISLEIPMVFTYTKDNDVDY